MESKILLPDLEWLIKRILRFIQLPQLDALMNYNSVNTHGKMSYTMNTITQATVALYLTAQFRCWTCEHVSLRQHVNKFWACAGGPGVENDYCKHRWTSLALQEGTNPPKRAFILALLWHNWVNAPSQSLFAIIKIVQCNQIVRCEWAFLLLACDQVMHTWFECAFVNKWHLNIKDWYGWLCPYDWKYHYSFNGWSRAILSFLDPWKETASTGSRGEVSQMKVLLSQPHNITWFAMHQWVLCTQQTLLSGGTEVGPRDDEEISQDHFRLCFFWSSQEWNCLDRQLSSKSLLRWLAVEAISICYRHYGTAVHSL